MQIKRRNCRGNDKKSTLFVKIDHYCPLKKYKNIDKQAHYTQKTNIKHPKKKKKNTK